MPRSPGHGHNGRSVYPSLVHSLIHARPFSLHPIGRTRWKWTFPLLIIRPRSPGLELSASAVNEILVKLWQMPVLSLGKLGFILGYTMNRWFQMINSRMHNLIHINVPGLMCMIHKCTSFQRQNVHNLSLKCNNLRQLYCLILLFHSSVNLMVFSVMIHWCIKLTLFRWNFYFHKNPKNLTNKTFWDFKLSNRIYNFEFTMKSNQCRCWCSIQDIVEISSETLDDTHGMFF